MYKVKNIIDEVKIIVPNYAWILEKYPKATIFQIKALNDLVFI